MNTTQPEWNEIKTDADIENLLDLFGGFHDSCLRELHLSTDHHVDLDLSMTCGNDVGYRVRMLFQRQFTNPSAIELLFERVTKLNIVPAPENCSADIFDVALLNIDDVFYWAEEEEWTIDAEWKDEITWISAKNLKWRIVNDWMKAELRYGSPAPKIDIL